MLKQKNNLARWANHGTMCIAYDVTSCAKLKRTVSSLNFGFEVKLRESKRLMTEMKQTIYHT